MQWKFAIQGKMSDGDTENFYVSQINFYIKNPKLLKLAQLYMWVLTYIMVWWCFIALGTEVQSGFTGTRNRKLVSTLCLLLCLWAHFSHMWLCTVAEYSFPTAEQDSLCSHNLPHDPMQQTCFGLFQHFYSLFRFWPLENFYKVQF